MLFISKLLVIFIHFQIFAKEDIYFWHAMDGFLNEKLEEKVNKYNLTQKDHVIHLVAFPNYKVLIEKYFQEREKPDILQVYEVAFTSFAKIYKSQFSPIEELFQEENLSYSSKDIFKNIKDFYTVEGKILALPWNVSTGVLFYNKDVFKKAQIQEEDLKTWEGLEKILRKLKSQGYPGYTTQWPVAYNLENVAALHNIPFTTLNNGFDSGTPQFIFHKSKTLRKHIQKVTSFKKENLFIYERDSNKASDLFAEGQVSILMGGANREGNIKKRASFEIGSAPIPYISSVVKKPYRLNFGGGSLWVSKVHKKGTGQFIHFLSGEESQEDWHKETGYLPISKNIFEKLLKSGFYKTHQAAFHAARSVFENRGGQYTKGIRVPNYIEARQIIQDYLEEIFDGKISSKKGLEKAAWEANKAVQ